MTVEGKCEVGLKDTHRSDNIERSPENRMKSWKVLHTEGGKGWGKKKKHYREVKPREVEKVGRVPGY